MSNKMILSNTDTIPDRKYEIVGLVSGVGFHYAALENYLGNGIQNGVNQAVHHTETLATTEMINNAIQMGCDGIIGIKYSMISSRGTLVFVSGTGIKFIDNVSSV